MQHGQQTQEPTLSQNYGVNDWMLCYHCIHEDFIMDTFFAMSKGRMSSRGNTCCQLFVMDKGYLYMDLMKRKGEVLQVVKSFAKEVGAPDVIISNTAREQLSQEVKHFCNLIGMMLHTLEEGTPWSNHSSSQGHEGGQLALCVLGLLSQMQCKDLQPYCTGPAQGPWD